MRVGRNDEAIEYFFQARDVAPRSVPILLMGAQALYVGGHKAEADAIFRRIIATPVPVPGPDAVPSPARAPVPRLAPSWWGDFSAGFAARMIDSTRPVRRAA